MKDTQSLEINKEQQAEENESDVEEDDDMDVDFDIDDDDSDDEDNIDDYDSDDDDDEDNSDKKHMINKKLPGKSPIKTAEKETKKSPVKAVKNAAKAIIAQANDASSQESPEKKQIITKEKNLKRKHTDDDDEDDVKKDMMNEKLPGRSTINAEREETTSPPVKEVVNASKAIKKDDESPQKSPEKGQNFAKTGNNFETEDTDETERIINLLFADLRARERRSLILGNLPFKQLAKNRLRGSVKKEIRKYVQLFFSSEAKAEEMFQEEKIGNTRWTLDFCGEKSKSNPDPPIVLSNYMFKLYIAFLPVDVTMDLIAKHFKNAASIIFRSSKNGYRQAVAVYYAARLAADDLEANKALTLAGQKIRLICSPIRGFPTERKNESGRLVQTCLNCGGSGHRSSVCTSVKKSNGKGYFMERKFKPWS